MSPKINHYSEFLIRIFVKDHEKMSEQGVTVNPIVSEIASWYEKLRNAMEYRQEEVVFQTTIERILKRRIILGGSGKEIARPLIKELVWARYLPDGGVSEATIIKAEERIRFYLKVKEEVSKQKKMKDTELSEWIFHLMSSDLEHMLAHNPEKEAMINYIFHTLEPNITLENQTDETKSAQLFIAIHRMYAKDNLALLRYNMFFQYFGEANHGSVEHVALEFNNARIKIERELKFPLRHKIGGYVKKFVAPFLILQEVLSREKGNVHKLIENDDELTQVIFATCDRKYKDIKGKVRRAIVRSVIFILLTKVLFAFLIEGSYERFFYGTIQWSTIVLNIAIPTSLMIIAGFFITTPGRENTRRIALAIKQLLFDARPTIGYKITLQDPTQKTKSITDNVFTALWLATFVLSFGFIIYVLNKLSFNPVSQGIFVFFVAIVSFLVYRIYQTAHIYTLEEKQSLRTLAVDFFFLPIARVGRMFTEGISQVNILIFFFDFIIETPFKGLFAFFDQWFIYLHNKRENLE